MNKLETVAFMYSLKKLMKNKHYDDVEDVIDTVLEAAEVEGMKKDFPERDKRDKDE